MANRLDLQTQLERILGSRNVYFQPPASISMQYPAIRYELKDIRAQSANNSSAYVASTGYVIILITKEPDTKYLNQILNIPYCKFDRYYRADNLHHYTFTIYQ